MNLIGSLIIAPPAMKGNFWSKSVVLLTENHTEGTIGIILNKRSQLSIIDFGQQINCDLDYPGYVYIGGPINSKSLSFLHTNDWSCKNTMRINNLFSISSADDIIPRLAMGDCPRHWRIFLGLCGWGPGQLMGEIKGCPPWKHELSWCVSSSDLSLVFDHDGDQQWEASLERSGLEFAQNIL